MVDLAIINGRVMVIELNPFVRFQAFNCAKIGIRQFIKTGACLFNWERDKKLLTLGLQGPDESDFEFRIIDSDTDRRNQGFMDVRAQYPQARASKKAFF